MPTTCSIGTTNAKPCSGYSSLAVRTISRRGEADPCPCHDCEPSPSRNLRDRCRIGNWSADYPEPALDRQGRRIEYRESKAGPADAPCGANCGGADVTTNGRKGLTTPGSDGNPVGARSSVEGSASGRLLNQPCSLTSMCRDAVHEKTRQLCSCQAWHDGVMPVCER